MINAIFDKINQAFDAGEVTKDLLKSITVLSALSDKSFNHICSIIYYDLGQARSIKAYGPTEIWQFIKEKQTLLEADRSSTILIDMVPIMYAVKPTRGSKLVCSTYKTHVRGTSGSCGTHTLAEGYPKCISW